MTSGIEHFSAAIARAGRAARGQPAWLVELRQRAARHFGEQGLPGKKHEEWKYTRVEQLGRIPWTSPAEAALSLPDREQLAEHLLEGCHQVVVVNGRFCPELCGGEPLPGGIQAVGLAEALQLQGVVLEQRLGRYSSLAAPFVALNTALLDDGVYLELDADVVAEHPIQLLFVTTAEGAAIHPRTLVACGRGSQATLVESYVALGATSYLTNAVTELVLGENAMLDHAKIQCEAASAQHLATIQGRQARDATWRSFSFSLGAKLARNDINSRLDGEGAHCAMSGLYIVGDEQHVDHHTLVDHVRAHCTSEELYKGILDDRARGVFNGKIYVHPKAQKTDAVQSNKNLLLSEQATINTKPQLEIFADDVRCTHGATVGQVDADALFYLRTRGLSEAEAFRLLVTAFASEVLDAVKNEHVRAKVERLVREKLPEGA